MKKLRQWQCGLLVSLLLMSPPATAQDGDNDAPDIAPTQQSVELKGLRVVGSRTTGRSAADSAVPVEIIDGDSFRNYGVRHLDKLLAATIPSYNVSEHNFGEANALVRPAKLRGLPPDSTLVLINGKRRHRSAAISTFTYGQAQGAHPVDIRSIPSIALKRVEVLRAGAAAQYGSDAVAGVMNFVLRDAPEGGTLEARWGQHYHGDGDLVSTAANVGLPLTEAGFANFSFEFTNSDSTSRSTPRTDEQRLRAAGLPVKNPSTVWGAVDVKYDYKFFGNLGLDLGNHHHAYAFGSWAERKVGDSWYFRSPVSRPGVFTDDWGGNLLIADLSPTGRDGGCPTNINGDEYLQDPQAALSKLGPDCYWLGRIFPGGFTPRMDGYVEDWGLAFGLRGELQSAFALLNGWHYDMSAVFGEHSISLYVRNSVNPQLAFLREHMPTKFHGRAYEERDTVFNLDLSRPVDIGTFYSPLNVAFGLEYREEEFEIIAGEKDGWCTHDDEECEGGDDYAADRGLAEQGFSIGTNGYPSLQPESAGEANRGSFGAYLDLEADVIKRVLVNAAGRFEHHEGIGESLDGRLSGRWDLLGDYLAVRGSLGTGFRAPTVGQMSYRDSTFAFADGRLVEVKTLPSDDPIAQYLGAEPLKPETSFSFSVGTVLTLGALSVTLDYYNIEVRNRVGLSESLALNDDDLDALDTLGIDTGGVTSVRYFANAFETYTQGIDLIATYPLELFGGGIGTTLLTFAGNWNDTKINLDSINPNVVGALRKHQIEEHDPQFRFSLMADHEWGAWRFLARLHYYHDFTEWQNIGSDHIYSHARVLLDMEASYTFDFGITVAAGAENLFDKYPTKNPYRRSYGQTYPVISPYGYSGGFYYFRAGFEWG